MKTLVQSALAALFLFVSGCKQKAEKGPGENDLSSNAAINKTLVLMYHEIVAPGQKPSNGKPWTWTTSDVTAKAFEEQLKWLQNNGYTSISVQELKNASAKKISLPNKPVLLTFDDAYIGNYNSAVPLLRKYKMKGSFFIVTGMVDIMAGKASSCGVVTGRDHLTWDMVKEIDADPLMEIEVHSHCHPNGGMPVVADANLDREMVTPRKLIQEKTGRWPIAFAYPQGKHNKREVDVLTKYYQIGFAVNARPAVWNEVFQIQRLDVGENSENISKFACRVKAWMSFQQPNSVCG